MTPEARVIDPFSAHKLEGVELGRAMAAIAVVMHHASQASDGFTTQVHSSWFDWGAYGVDFFFVLSGFIIYHVHCNDARTGPAAWTFLRKRLRRIYIPYLPVTLVLIAAYLALPDIAQGDRDWGWLTSLTLLPSASPPALSVAWTLIFELTFYLFFLLFYATRYFWLLVASWGLAILFTAIATTTPPTLLKTVLDPLVFEFFAGMIAAHLFARLPSSIWLVPTLLGAVLVGSFALQSDLHRAFVGIGLAPMVLGLALAERKFRFRLPPSFLLLGAASYSIYLVHGPFQSLVARLFRGPDLWVVTFLACCLGGILLGIAYHRLFERPALRLRFSRPLPTKSQF